MKWSICIAGKGGQGVRKVGECLAEAAILEGMEVVQVSQYTPEVRGGDSSTDIIISQREIYYPLIEKIDILLALNKNGYINNIPRIFNKTFIIYDSDLIQLPSSLSDKIGIPFEDIAKKELEKPILSNMIGLGVLVQITNIVHPENVLKVIKKRIEKFTEKNVQAFLKGLRIGKEIKERKKVWGYS